MGGIAGAAHSHTEHGGTFRNMRGAIAAGGHIDIQNMGAHSHTKHGSTYLYRWEQLQVQHILIQNMEAPSDT